MDWNTLFAITLGGEFEAELQLLADAARRQTGLIKDRPLRVQLEELHTALTQADIASQMDGSLSAFSIQSNASNVAVLAIERHLKAEKIEGLSDHLKHVLKSIDDWWEMQDY